MNWALFALFAYVAAQLVIGFVVARRVRSERDYLLAGRRLGPVLACVSVFATWFGAETCIGATQRVASEGLAGGRADPFGYLTCLLLMGLVFAVPLWRRGVTTLADLFRERWSGGVERLAAVIMIPSSVLWAAAQIRAFGQVLASVSTLERDVAIAFAALVVIVYTASGGLLADVFNDMVQGTVLVLGFAVLTFAIVQQEDVGAMWQQVPAERLALAVPGESPWVTVETWAGVVLGSVVAQELVTRVLASRSAGVARGATLAAAPLYLLVGLVPVTIGLLGPQLLGAIDDGEQLLPRVAQKYLSPALMVVFAGALVSAILSTVDSCLLTAGSLASHNLVVPLARIDSEAFKLRAARIAVVLAGLVAYVLAIASDSIFDLVQASSTFGSSGVFVLVVCALFVKWGGPASAYAALVLGVGTWGVLTLVGFEYPFLASLAAATFGYMACVPFARGAPPPTVAAG